MPEAAGHAMAKIPAMCEPCVMAEAVAHTVADAMVEPAVPAIVKPIATIRHISVITIVIRVISVAGQGAAVCRVIYGLRRTGILAGIRLRRRRLRSGERRHGQPDAAR